MSNLIFPDLPGLSASVMRSAIWSTDVKSARSGKRFSRAHWSYPRWSYKLKYEFMRSGSFQELEALVGFFNQHGGDYDTWLFRDPDARIASRVQFGTGDGVTVAWQLQRSVGGFLEPVKEVDGAVTAYADGTVTPATVSAHTGVITFATPPAAGKVLDASFAYFLRCRFNRSTLETDRFMEDLWQGQVEFSTEK